MVEYAGGSGACRRRLGKRRHGEGSQSLVGVEVVGVQRAGVERVGQRLRGVGVVLFALLLLGPLGAGWLGVGLGVGVQVDLQLARFGVGLI